MLLPMPGSPPSSVTEPGTSPPPSTRSSSSTPVGARRRDAGVDVADRHRAGPAARPAPTGAGAAAAPTSSTSVPHASHAGQRPSHRGDSPPHSEHRCTDRVFMTGPYDGGTTRNPRRHPVERVTSATAAGGDRHPCGAFGVAAVVPTPGADGASRHGAVAGPADSITSTASSDQHHRDDDQHDAAACRAPTSTRRPSVVLPAHARAPWCVAARAARRPPSARTSRGARRAATGRCAFTSTCWLASDGDDVGIGGQPGLQIARGRACRVDRVASSRTAPWSRVHGDVAQRAGRCR